MKIQAMIPATSPGVRRLQRRFATKQTEMATSTCSLIKWMRMGFRYSNA